MNVNSLAQNELADTIVCVKPARSGQDPEATELTSRSPLEERAGDENSPQDKRDNSLECNALRELKTTLASANASNPIAVYRMRETGRRSESDLARSKLIRWCKFNFVGGIGILVQFAALFLLKSLLHFEYLTATAVAVEIAVLHNFLWHERFTWADRTGARRTALTSHRWQRPLERLARFHAGNGAVSIVGNMALMKVLVGQGGMNYLAANAIAIALCSVANFLVSEQWVFAE